MAGKLSHDQARNLQNAIGSDRVMPVDTGAGVNLLYAGAKPGHINEIAGRAVDAIGSEATAGSPYMLRGRQGDTMFEELPWQSPEFGPPRSGAVTEGLLGALRQRHPEGGTYMDRLDNPETRAIAADALAKYSSMQKGKGGTNPALMNFLDIVSQKGLRALPKALRSREVLLPGLAAIGVGTLIIEEVQRELEAPQQGLLGGS
jgi:hypothetical protein